MEVSPDYETDEEIPIKGVASLQDDQEQEPDTTEFAENGQFRFGSPSGGNRRSDTQLNFNLKTGGSTSSDPPLSAKSTTSALEDNETLDDFVRREREIAEELENSGEFQTQHFKEGNLKNSLLKRRNYGQNS